MVAPVSTDDNATAVNQSQLKLSDSVADATWQILKAETFDKTFILIIIFTISWTNWEQKDDVKKDHIH